MPSAIIDMIESNGFVGDFAMPIDEDTMLCRVDGEYYYVKATTEEAALALLRAELTVIKPDIQTE